MRRGKRRRTGSTAAPRRVRRGRLTSKQRRVLRALLRARTVTFTSAVRCGPVRRRNASYSRAKAHLLTKKVKRIEEGSFAVIPKSGAAKTKGIATTYSTSKSCPDACSFKGQGCYAEGGQVGIHWQGVDSQGKVGGHIAGVNWKDFLAALANVPPTIRFKRGGRFVTVPRRLRFNVAGDLPGINNRIDRRALERIVRAAGGTMRQQFTYTHKPVLDPDVWGQETIDANLRALREARKHGLVVNLSADTLADADRKAALGMPVVLTLPSEAATREGAKKYDRTPEGRRVVICPAVAASRAETFKGKTTGKRRTKTSAASDYLSCAQCGGMEGVALCARGDRDYVVGFPAHGQDEKRAEEVFFGTAPTAAEKARFEQMRAVEVPAEARLKSRGLKILRNGRLRRVWRRFRTTARRPVLAVVLPWRAR